MKVDVDRIPQRQHRGFDVDLNGAGGPVLGQKFRPRKARADHQQRVAPLHQVPAWLGAEQADRAGDEGQVVRQHVLSEQCLRHAGSEKSGHFDQQWCRATCAGADQHRYLLAGIQDFRRLRQVGILWNDLGPGVTDARSRKPVRHRGLLVLLVLNVLWQDDDGRRVVGFRDPHASVQKVPHLSRRRCFLHEARDVREHAVQVEFLLVAGAADGRFGLAADRENRSMIQFAVVQAGDQVGRSGAAGRQAYSQFAGELGVCDRHEGGHFLVPDLDEFDVAGPLQRADHAVDAVAWITVDAANAPSVQPFDDEITDLHLKTPDWREAMRFSRSDLAA